MKIIFTIAITIISLDVSSAFSEEKISIDTALHQHSIEAAELCSHNKKMLETHPDEASEILGIIKYSCECLPLKIREVRSGLTAQNLSSQVTIADFQARYADKLVYKCGADLSRSQFANSCERQKSNRPKNYCECLSGQLAELSDADVIALGIAASEELPRAEKAKRKGMLPPEESRLLKYFHTLEASCQTK